MHAPSPPRTATAIRPETIANGLALLALLALGIVWPGDELAELASLAHAPRGAAAAHEARPPPGGAAEHERRPSASGLSAAPPAARRAAPLQRA